MSFVKVAELAEEFLIKIAERHYEDNAPADVKSDDLKWVDPGERWLIKQNGKNDKFLPHNPPGAIASEKIWDKAKKAVKKYWKKYDEPWAVVYDVYRKMGGKPKAKKKKKSKK
jgi:hypothetical protein